MGRLSICLFVIAALSLWNVAVQGQEISLISKHLCSDAGNGQMRFTINLHDENRQTIAMRALNETMDEINTCVITQRSSLANDGLTNRTFTIVSFVTLATNTENNNCGMRTWISGGKTYYTWYFRASSAITIQGVIRRGFVMNATCEKDSFTDGVVTTLAKFNITNMFVTARLSSGVTGENTFANNSEVTLTAIIYPSGLETPADLQNAKGFYLRNCYSGTDPQVLENRELIVNATGCPVPGARYAPSSPPQKRANTGTSPLIVDASFIRVSKIGDESMVYIECQVVKCLTEGDTVCDNACNAGPGAIAESSASVTTAELSTNFGVQDNPTQQFSATLPGQTTPISTVTINVNPAIQMRAAFAPNGIGTVSNSLFRQARGFYLYSCFYADNAEFVNPVQFVDSGGCILPGTKLSAAAEFAQVSSANNLYVIESGLVTLQSVTSYLRLWSRCFIGACLIDGHNYCIRRCNAANNGNANDAQNLNLVAEFSVALLNTTTQSTVTIEILDASGANLAGSGATATVGEDLQFGLSVFPGGTGQASNLFGDAKGIFVRNCYVSTVPDPTEDQKTYIINGTGCRIPGPYMPSQDCRLDNRFPGEPPFNISCGTFTAQEAGTLIHRCQIGTCKTENNPVCLDRCAAGELTANSNAEELPLTFSAQTQVVPLDNRRTAVRSNEIRSAVIAVTVVAPIAVMGTVGIITYCIVNSQRPKP